MHSGISKNVFRFFFVRFSLLITMLATLDRSIQSIIFPSIFDWKNHSILYFHSPLAKITIQNLPFFFVIFVSYEKEKIYLKISLFCCLCLSITNAEKPILKNVFQTFDSRAFYRHRRYHKRIYTNESKKKNRGRTRWDCQQWFGNSEYCTCEWL